MIHEVVAAMAAKASASDLAAAIHAYPTFAEGIKVTAGVLEHNWKQHEHRQKRVESDDSD